ncbi:MAG TPA: hypothetical protein VFB62_16760 [Polyangiaceae bacterium]|nr:hypothetical protein [Polyangiaceae bacterium]
MTLDWLRLDRELTTALRAWRRASSMLERDPSASDVCPIPERLVHGERVSEVADSDDPLARAFLPWLEALSSERGSWDDRVALARHFQTRVPVPVRATSLSLRELRAEMWQSEHAGERHALGVTLAESSGTMSDAAVNALERRLEREGRAIEVAGVDAALVEELAGRWLEATRDLAAPWQRCGWVDGLRAAFGSDAHEGWPARLRPRWIEDVFANTRLAAGLSIELGALPEAWGAASFCRALGMFGVSLLDASRPAAMPLALHQHPRGTRRHTRFALFAALPAERSFAERVLTLGRGRGLDQSRRVAAALLCSLRVDALRVRLAASLSRGENAFRETFAEVTETMFGEPLPSSLAGVLPRLRAADAPAFVGSIVAIEDRDALVGAYDEDWFRNPHAAERLRQADQSMRDDERDAERCLVSAVQRFETILG